MVNFILVGYRSIPSLIALLTPPFAETDKLIFVKIAMELQTAIPVFAKTPGQLTARSVSIAAMESFHLLTNDAILL